MELWLQVGGDAGGGEEPSPSPASAVIAVMSLLSSAAAHTELFLYARHYSNFPCISSVSVQLHKGL